MGRQPKIRASYIADAGFLNRLAQAVERDPVRTPKWKKAVSLLINDLTTVMSVSPEYADDMAEPIIRMYESGQKTHSRESAPKRARRK